MDSVKNVYKMYYTQLTPFITALEAKLPASPSDLQYVDVVTKIVKPGSDDFNDRQYVVKQILLAFDVTTLIILEVGKFLPADDQAWLTQSSGLINMYIGLCKMSIASLPDGQAEIDSVSGGIGGINKGVYSRTNVEYLSQILKLASALKTSG